MYMYNVHIYIYINFLSGKGVKSSEDKVSQTLWKEDALK